MVRHIYFSDGFDYVKGACYLTAIVVTLVNVYVDLLVFTRIAGTS